MRPFEFNLVTLPYTELCGLCRWSMSRSTQFPAFCTWLADVLGSEGLRREESPETLPSGYISLPEHWTNADVAEALEGSTALSYAENIDAETTGKLLDKIAIHIAALAARRLRERHAVGAN
jgi:hypothetical protein